MDDPKRNKHRIVSSDIIISLYACTCMSVPVCTTCMHECICTVYVYMYLCTLHGIYMHVYVCVYCVCQYIHVCD